MAHDKKHTTRATIIYQDNVSGLSISDARKEAVLARKEHCMFVTLKRTGSIGLLGTIMAFMLTICLIPLHAFARDGGNDTDIPTLSLVTAVGELSSETAMFDVNPYDAIVNVYDGNNVKIEPNSDGTFSGVFSESEYTYSIAKAGYKSVTGVIPAQGGIITVVLERVTDAQPNDVDAFWYNFRNSEVNMAVVDIETPIDPNATQLIWAKNFGTGWAVNPSMPLIIDDALIVTSNKTIYKLDCKTGDIITQGVMADIVNFGYTPMTYAEGMVFVPIAGGIQAFNAKTLESLWVYKDKLGGQTLSQMVYSDGYIYTGYWNSESRDANYACVSITDEDATQTTESKIATWTYPSPGGFYWAGGIALGDYIVVGSDDGASGSDGNSVLRAFNKKTGKVSSSIVLEGFGDQRSSIAYYAENERLYFTSKNGHVASVAFDASAGMLSDLKSYASDTQCTGTPVVYDGVVYLGIGEAYDNPGNFLALDADTLEFLYVKPLKGYPQASLLLSVAYKNNGYLYFYTTYNANPGGLQMVKVPVGNKTGKNVVVSDIYDAAGYSSYCICSPIVGHDGTIYYKNDSNNVLAVGIGTANTLPELVDGVPGMIEVNIEVGSTYELDLSSIFYDADGDTLTYMVSVDDDNPIAADSIYSYTPTTYGVKTLEFTANDGKANSMDTYTVILTVQNSGADHEAFLAAKETAEQKAEAAEKALREANDAAEAATKAAEALAAATDPAAKVAAAQAYAAAAQTAVEKARAAAAASAEAAEAAKAVEAAAVTDEQKSAAADLVAAAAADQEKAAEAQTEADNVKKAADEAKKAADEAKKAADEANKKAEEAAKVKVGETYTVGGMGYKVTSLAASANGTATLVKAKDAKKVVVPATVKLADGKDYSVDVIAAKAFNNLKKVTTVTVGANVKKIQKSAFFKTPNLKKLVVKSKLLKKKASVKAALKGSKAKKLTVKVPKKLKKAYSKSFSKANIKAPKKVTVK